MSLHTRPLRSPCACLGETVPAIDVHAVFMIGTRFYKHYRCISSHSASGTLLWHLSS